MRGNNTKSNSFVSINTVVHDALNAVLPAVAEEIEWVPAVVQELCAKLRGNWVHTGNKSSANRSNTNIARVVATGLQLAAPVRAVAG